MNPQRYKRYINTNIFCLYFKECIEKGGKCETTIDGYYLECLICLIYGLLWYKIGATQIRNLQAMPLKAWRVIKADKRRR